MTTDSLPKMLNDSQSVKHKVFVAVAVSFSRCSMKVEAMMVNIYMFIQIQVPQLTIINHLFIFLWNFTGWFDAGIKIMLRWKTDILLCFNNSLMHVIYFCLTYFFDLSSDYVLYLYFSVQQKRKEKQKTNLMKQKASKRRKRTKRNIDTSKQC